MAASTSAFQTVINAARHLNVRVCAAAVCFAIGAATEIYTGTKVTNYYDASNKLVKKESEFQPTRATGLGWGLVAGAMLLL